MEEILKTDDAADALNVSTAISLQYGADAAAAYDKHKQARDYEQMACIDKYQDKSIVRRADSVTIKSLANKRGIFVVDIIGKNFSTRTVIHKGEMRFIYEQTEAGICMNGEVDDMCGDSGERRQRREGGRVADVDQPARHRQQEAHRQVRRNGHLA